MYQNIDDINSKFKKLCNYKALYFFYFKKGNIQNTIYIYIYIYIYKTATSSMKDCNGGYVGAMVPIHFINMHVLDLWLLFLLSFFILFYFYVVDNKTKGLHFQVNGSKNCNSRGFLDHWSKTHIIKYYRVQTLNLTCIILCELINLNYGE